MRYHESDTYAAPAEHLLLQHQRHEGVVRVVHVEPQRGVHGLQGDARVGDEETHVGCVRCGEIERGMMW